MLRVRARVGLSVMLWCAIAPAGHRPADAQTMAPETAVATLPADLDARVDRVMRTFEVPGLALAVVKDGRVLTARGYGLKRVGEAAHVDADTLFCIASNTKVFTATALALLVEEGKLAWDAPVIRYLPWFQMWDPYVTRELAIRDLLVHRSGLGLGAGDLLWWPESTYTRREIARRLRFIRPATSFRSGYAYDNVLYLVAGEVIEAVSGQPWEEFVAGRILQPVDMTESRVRLSEVAGGGNIATPHARIDGTVRPVMAFDSDNTNPAGGILSSAGDMAKWIITLLNEGVVANGRPRLFSPATARELSTLVTPMPAADLPAELSALATNFRGYALGLGVHDYRGRKVVTHTGGLPGFVSKVTMLPELELGIVVLTNQESGDAFNALTMQIVDHFLEAPATDWVDAYRTVRQRRDAETEKRVREDRTARAAGSTPSLPLAAYAGAYTDAWYGEIDVREENGGLVLSFSHTPALVGDVEHWQHDTFIVRWRDRELRADAYLTFSLDPRGRVAEARMEPVSPATDFSFDFEDLRLVPAPADP